jgi:hypothetical protein
MLQNFITEANDIFEQLAFFGCKKTFCGDYEEHDFASELEMVAAKVRETWASAVCSDAGEEALTRHFTYQVSYLSGLLVSSGKHLTVGCSCHAKNPELLYQESVCGLIDFAVAYFDKYLSRSTSVGRVYKKHFTNILSGHARLISAELENSGLDPQIKNCLISYLEDMIGETDLPCDLGQLHYFRSFVRELLPAASLDDGSEFCGFVKDRLFDMEFNHFSIFVHMQGAIRDAYTGKRKNQRNAVIRRELDFLTFKAKGDIARYDERWPSLSTMLTEWLNGELPQEEQKTAIENKPTAQAFCKLRLVLPVSHLAFLIRLLSKENIFGLTPLTEIFGFFTANFSTKRKETLSIGGLSKEYYTKNMVTAVEVRALLSKMIARINRDYFPVWIAVSIAILCATVPLS